MNLNFHYLKRINMISLTKKHLLKIKLLTESLYCSKSIFELYIDTLRLNGRCCRYSKYKKK